MTSPHTIRSARSAAASSDPGPPAYVALKLSSARRRRFRAGRRVVAFCRIIVPVALILLWQLGSDTNHIPPEKLVSPTTVLRALGDLNSSGLLWSSVGISLRRAGIGFLFGAGVGLSLGIVCGLARFAEVALDLLLQMLRTVPFMALTPLFVLWFGIGELPKELLIAVACVFPIYLNTYAGVRNADPKLLETATVFGVGRWPLTFRIIFPLALPTVLIGIRYALGVSLLALVAAEQVNASSGIGYLALSPQAALRPDILLAVVFIYAILGIAIDLFMRTVTRLTLPWHRTVIERSR